MLQLKDKDGLYLIIYKLLTESTPKIKRHRKVKSYSMEKRYNNHKPKGSEVAILTLEKTDLKARSIIRGKEVFHDNKKLDQKDLANLNLCVHNKIASTM